MTHLDSLHKSLLYLLHDSYRLWLIVVIISNRLLYIIGLSLADSSPVWPHFYTVPLAQIYLCSLPYIRSQGLKDSLALFIYWISLPSTEHECKLENAITQRVGEEHMATLCLWWPRHNVQAEKVAVVWPAPDWKNRLDFWLVGLRRPVPCVGESCWL